MNRTHCPPCTLVLAHTLPSMRAAPLVVASMLAALAGCETPGARTDVYDRSLAHWQGASEQSLRAAWGTPRTEEAVEGGKVLVYVTDHVSATQDHPTFSIGLGGFGWGGSHTSVGGGVGLSAPIGAQAGADSCTTRFLIHAERIESWTFEGGGCGKPVL